MYYHQLLLALLPACRLLGEVSRDLLRVLSLISCTTTTSRPLTMQSNSGKVHGGVGDDVWEAASGLVKLYNGRATGCALDVRHVRMCSSPFTWLEKSLRYKDGSYTSIPAYKNPAVPMPLRKIADTMKPGRYWTLPTKTRRRH